jgi:drug/metabolite transporter (DMT)-like permease
VPLDALGLALAAGVLHAGWNTLLRGSTDVQATTAAALGLGLVIFAPVAALTGHVPLAAWPYMASSGALETVYFFLLVAAYKQRELSVVYPIARGSAPVLVLIGSAVVLGRAVSGGEAAGVILVTVGVLLVRGIARRADGLAIGLAIGLCIAGYTLTDKTGIRHASPVPYLELTMTPSAVAACGWLVARRGIGALRSQARWTTVAAAIGSFGAYALVLAALRLASAPSVAAVRETSIVVAALFAAVFLHERVTPQRLAGAVAVAGGVALLALS